MDPPDGPPVAEPSRHQAGVAGRQTMASGTAHGSGDDRSAQQQQPLHCAGSAAGTASDPSSALGQWPKQYSYMCGGLFKPQAANTAEAARQPDHQDDDEDKGNYEEGEDEDEDERQLYGPGGKVYYLTRRAEAISPVQDAQLRGTAGLFCRDGINDEDAEEGDCLDDLAEAYPLEFFPWPHAEDGTLEDAIAIARQSLADDPKGSGNLCSNPVFFLDAQSPLDNTVLGVELTWGSSDPEDNDPVPGIVWAYGRLPVRDMSVFLCIADVKGFSLEEWFDAGGTPHYCRDLVLDEADG